MDRVGDRGVTAEDERCGGRGRGRAIVAMYASRVKREGMSKVRGQGEEDKEEGDEGKGGGGGSSGSSSGSKLGQYGYVWV